MPKTHIENLHNNGTVNINHQAPHIIPKVLTQQVGLANDIDFIGRKDELQKVDELLNQNSMLLLLNGIGGIGKSTLASYYLNQKKDEYDYYGFVQVNEDIKLSLASAFSTSLNLQSEKIDDLFAEIMNKLQNLEGKKLLIIDDVKEMDNQLDEMNALMTLKNSGFKILFTSREVKEYIPQYFLDIMSITDARELFLKHFPTDDMDKVDKILEYVDYHTLFIEITAKTLKKRKNTLSLDIAIEKFENGGFSAVKRNKSESFNKFLKNFSHDSSILTQKKTLLFLKRLSVLPSIEISFENLYKFLVCNDKEQLEDFLIELVDNGWLIESQHHYKFHQILKEFVFDNYLASFEEIETQVDFLSELIVRSSDILVALNNRSNILFFENLIRLLDKQNIENQKFAKLLSNLGNIYSFLGSYKKSEVSLTKALKIWERKLGNKHPYVLTLYNNLASVYKSIGRLEDAEKLYLKCLKESKEVLGENHLDTIATYNNLAGLYQIMGLFEDAESLYLRSLKAKEEILGKNDINTITSYNNLAGLYRLMGLFEKAEIFYIKSLNVRKKVLGKNHPDTATSYNNLALFYETMGKFDKAKILYLKAIDIREKVLGIKHLDTATTYNNLAKLNQSMGMYKNAESLYIKDMTTTEELLGDNHPSTATSYNNLGGLYKLMGIFKKAELFYLKATKIRENVLGKKHSDTAISYSNLAGLYMSNGQSNKAEQFYIKSLKVNIEIWGVHHPSIATLYNNLAVFYYSQNNFEKACNYMQDAINIREIFLPYNHPDLLNSKEGLKMIKIKLNQNKKI